MKPEEFARAFVTKHVGHYYCEPGDDPCPQHPDGLWQNKPCDCQFEDKVTALTAVIQAAVEAEREKFRAVLTKIGGMSTGSYCTDSGTGMDCGQCIDMQWEATLALQALGGKPCE